MKLIAMAILALGAWGQTTTPPCDKLRRGAMWHDPPTHVCMEKDGKYQWVEIEGGGSEPQVGSLSFPVYTPMCRYGSHPNGLCKDEPQGTLKLWEPKPEKKPLYTFWDESGKEWLNVDANTKEVTLLGSGITLNGTKPSPPVPPSFRCEERFDSGKVVSAYDGSYHCTDLGEVRVWVLMKEKAK